MPKKRSNNGKDRHNRGHTTIVRCTKCNGNVPKDKGIRRTTVKPIADKSVLKDLADATVYDCYNLPKVYNKVYYCVSCAVHLKLVKARSKITRKIRNPNGPVFKQENKPNNEGKAEEKTLINNAGAASKTN